MPPKNKTIHGYDGPTGAYVAAGGKIMSLVATPGGITALTNSALLTALGASPHAEDFAALTKASTAKG